MAQMPTQVINVPGAEPLLQAIMGLQHGLMLRHQYDEEEKRRKLLEDEERRRQEQEQFGRDMSMAELVQNVAARTQPENAPKMTVADAAAAQGIPDMSADVASAAPQAGQPVRSFTLTPPGRPPVTIPIQYEPEILEQKRRAMENAGEAYPSTEEMRAGMPEWMRGLFPVGKMVPTSVVSNLARKDPIKYEHVKRSNPTTGVDEFGAFNPDTGKIEWDAPASQQEASPSEDLSGEDLLDHLRKTNAQDYANVVAILEGRVDPSQMAHMFKGRREYLMGLASRIDPYFDAGVVKARWAVQKDMTSGGGNNIRRSINTVIDHLGTLDDAVKDLAPYGGWATFMNTLRNSFLTNTGDPRTVAIREAALAVATEMAAALKGGTGRASPTEEEIKEQLKGLTDAQSPEQWRANIRTKARLLAGRLHALEDSWKNAFGTSPRRSFVSAKALDTAKKHGFLDALDIPDTQQGSDEGGIFHPAVTDRMEEVSAAPPPPGKPAAAPPPGPPSPAPQKQAAPALPKFGEIKRGWRYKGPEPATIESARDPKNWERAQ